MSENANDLIERLERETGQRIDDDNSLSFAGLIGAMSRELGKSNHQRRDDVAAGVVIQHQMTPAYKRQQEADEMLASLLMSGLSPDDAKNIMG
ncbi:MAG: hypothetical protein GY938_26945 [Ketobacter sp.]|nr:hypothetical protein [Ketobacter sp.]